MVDLLGLLIGGFILTGLVSRLVRLPLRSRTDEMTRSIVACTITVLSSVGVAAYMMGFGQAVVVYVSTSLAWLLIDLRRAPKMRQ